MNKSTKTLLLAVGTLSILAGVARYFQGNKMDALLALILGMSLIVPIYFSNSNPKDQQDK